MCEQRSDVQPPWPGRIVLCSTRNFLLRFPESRRPQQLPQPAGAVIKILFTCILQKDGISMISIVKTVNFIVKQKLRDLWVFNNSWAHFASQILHECIEIWKSFLFKISSSEIFSRSVQKMFVN